MESQVHIETAAIEAFLAPSESASSQPVLVLFTSRGNVACEILERGLATGARRAGIAFLPCRLHQSVATFCRYGVRRTPTLVLFETGYPAARWDGPPAIAAVLRWIEGLVAFDRSARAGD